MHGSTVAGGNRHRSAPAARNQAPLAYPTNLVLGAVARHHTGWKQSAPRRPGTCVGANRYRPALSRTGVVVSSIAQPFELGTDSPSRTTHRSAMRASPIRSYVALTATLSHMSPTSPDSRLAARACYW